MNILFHTFHPSKVIVMSKMISVEQYILSSFTHVPDSAMNSTAFKLLRRADAAPLPNLLDLARAAVEPHPSAFIRSFNPYLTDRSCNRLHQAILLWLQLCVLEDRLDRILELSNKPTEFKPTLIKV
jgi:hypothetical protein